MRKQPLLRRADALERTMNRFNGRPFEWGKADCWQMVRYHLRQMGHRRLPKCAPYKSAIGAKAALKGMGFDALEPLLDSMLPRIAPAAMWPGDLALMQGDSMFDAITISVGRKVYGWHDDSEVPVIIVPLEIKAAWRV